MTALRRMRLSQAIQALRTGPGSVPLSPAVSGLAFHFVDKNAEPGPREFIRTIAPRIAYANPALPIAINRIRDPRSKSLNPKNPDAGSEWPDDEKPGPSMVVAFHSRPSQTIPLRHLSGTQIWQQLSAVAGEDIASALEEPSAPKAEATDAPAS